MVESIVNVVYRLWNIQLEAPWPFPLSFPISNDGLMKTQNKTHIAKYKWVALAIFLSKDPKRFCNDKIVLDSRILSQKNRRKLD